MGGNPKPWHNGTALAGECVATDGKEFAVLQGDGDLITITGHDASYFKQGETYDIQVTLRGPAQPSSLDSGDNPPESTAS